MKLKEFEYVKKNLEKGNYTLMVLNENENHVSGIDLNKLNEEEREAVKIIQVEYEDKLKPFMKAYRSFIKVNIQE